MMDTPKSSFPSKKELLKNLLATLIDDLTDEEKEKLLHSLVHSGRQNRETIEMVEQ